MTSSRAWHILTFRQLCCQNCYNRILIPNSVDPATRTAWDLDQASREWVTDHCRSCGEGDELCNCLEPVRCSAVVTGDPEF